MNKLKEIEKQRKAILDAQHAKQMRREAEEAQALLHGGKVTG